MPFVMSFEKWGATYPESYWVRTLTSTNDKELYGIFTFNGYASLEDYNDNEPFIDQKQFLINDPNVYLAYIYPLTESLLSTSGTEALEAALLSLSDFFSTATQVANVIVRSAEIGANGSSRVTVIFQRGVALLSGDWHNGVTIKVDGVAATISASEQNPFEANELHFDLAAPVDPANEITWEYDMASGQITDLSGFVEVSQPPFRVTNAVGEYLFFDDENNVIWNVAI